MKHNIVIACFSVFLMSFGISSAQDRTVLMEGFRNPPKEARPRVWWHWMNGNISKEGIAKDLEWMKRSGIVGFHNFDAGLSTPQIVEKRIVYMTPEWKDAFSYAVNMAESLDMEMTIASSPGWSETGGPWVKPEEAMKKLVWRQLDIQGGRYISVKLPEGFNNMGPYQDYTLVSDRISQTYDNGKFYRDIAVVAVKIPDSEISMDEMCPSISVSGGKVTIENLTNDSVNDFMPVSPDRDRYCWISYELKEPAAIRSIVLSDKKMKGDANAIERDLQCSDDGVHFRTISRLGYQGAIEKTYNIPPTTAKFFRLRLRNTENDKSADCIGVSKFILSTVGRVQLAADKAGNSFYRLIAKEPTPDAHVTAKVSDVLDISDNFKNGVLGWQAPEGRWRIFRFGYGLTGKTNHPATKEATGLEVDKMNPDAVRKYFRNYLKTYEDAGGRLGCGGIEYLLTDSYEAGPQTWTDRMMEEFRDRKGYELTKWLPALTGMILDSADDTERFLFDWRRSIGEMIAEYHYDLQNEILKDYGMRRYTESHENYRAFLADGMDCKRYAEIPMAAFWMQYKQGRIFNSRFEADIRESASVAHVYGQNIAAAESFTTNGLRDGAWVFSPAVLKPTADAAMASGLNRFIIHTSPHQPVDDKIPGLGLGKYGQWFDRHQTWAEKAKVWTDYLSRSCYLLQQGRFVADIAYYYGEDNALTGLFLTERPDVPEGYNYDFFNNSILLDVAKVKDGMLVTPSGMTYKVLALDPNVKYMSIRVLRRLAELADAGVVICGAKPYKLAGREGSVEEFSELCDNIWNKGRKNVTAGVPIGSVLKSIGVEPDFDSSTDKDVRYVHRKIEGGEIYWVTNLSGSGLGIRPSFRVSGKKPVLWTAEDAVEKPVGYSIENDRTFVEMDLNKDESVFILFLDDTDTKSLAVQGNTYSRIAGIKGPWDVRFQEKRGAPASIILDSLASLSESDIEGVKYFSGAAVYSNRFILKRKNLHGKKSGGRIYLSMGEVRDIATVSVNGKLAGTLWHSPYTIDITDCVNKGENRIEIEVINMWHNRLVGDVQPDVSHKLTFTQEVFFKPDEPLLPSGLIGPVEVLECN